MHSLLQRKLSRMFLPPCQLSCSSKGQKMLFWEQNVLLLGMKFFLSSVHPLLKWALLFKKQTERQELSPLKISKNSLPSSYLLLCQKMALCASSLLLLSRSNAQILHINDFIVEWIHLENYLPFYKGDNF